MSEVSLLTCVRDASPGGGGVTGVALPVHEGMQRLWPESRLLCGLVSGSHIGEEGMGQAGSGFSDWTPPDVPWPVMHSHGLWTPFDLRACRAALAHRIPLVVSPHGMLMKWALAHKRWKKLIAWHAYQRKLIKAADLIVVNSELELLDLRRLGVRNPAAVIGNGVDTQGLPQNIVRSCQDKKVLFLSRLSPVKGIPELLRAWASIADRRGFTLLLQGAADRGYDDQVRRLIAELGLTDVRLCGPAYGEAKWQAFRNADVFVLPSHSENFGIVVAEAMLMGLPVITTVTTPWTEIESRGMGWLATATPESLAEALVRALNATDAERAAMGGRAREYALSACLWPEIIARYRDTYSWVLNDDSIRPAWVHVG